MKSKNMSFSQKHTLSCVSPEMAAPPRIYLAKDVCVWLMGRVWHHQPLGQQAHLHADVEEDHEATQLQRELQHRRQRAGLGRLIPRCASVAKIGHGYRRC